MSSLSFLTPPAGGSSSAAALARSPFERPALRAGGRAQPRDGWQVVVDYGDREHERELLAQTAGFADRSQLRKLELHGEHLAALGLAQLDGDGGWLCPVTPTRALLLGGGASAPDDAVDLTCGYAALQLTGPSANELLARFCAIDVRPKVMPVGAFRPGSVARTPGYVLRTAEDSLLLLVGWATGGYLWDVVMTAATHLNAGPVGAVALAEHEAVTARA